MAETRGGTNMYIQFICAAGTVTPAAQYRSVKPTKNPNLLETTSGSDGYKTFVAGIKEWDVAAEFLYNGTESPMGTADFAILYDNPTGTITVGPLGTAAGSPKFSGPVIVESCDPDFPYDELVTVSVTWRGNGTLALGTF